MGIPAEQRALRDAIRTDAATRSRAAELYEEVGTPPSILLRVFTCLTPLALVIVGVPVLLVGALVFYRSAGSAIGRALFHVELLDVYSEKTGFVASTGLGFTLGLLLLVLGALRAPAWGVAARSPGRPGHASADA